MASLSFLLTACQEVSAAWNERMRSRACNMAEPPPGDRLIVLHKAGLSPPFFN